MASSVVVMMPEPLSSVGLEQEVEIVKGYEGLHFMLAIKSVIVQSKQLNGTAY